MLSTIECLNSGEVRARLRGFDPRKQTWLVADLKTKTEIQKTLLQKNNPS